MCILFNLFIICAKTVLSLPPLIPIAIVSFGENKLFFVIVKWISSSNDFRKHGIHVNVFVFGRFNDGLLVLHIEHFFFFFFFFFE